jgi:hypothetical protein
MAAPSLSQLSTGSTDAGGAWSHTGNTTGDSRLIILQVLQDGSTAGAVALTGATFAEDLAGTAGTLDFIGSFSVGASGEAIQHLWIGRRTLAGSNPNVFSGTNSTSEDLYIRCLNFLNASTSTTLAQVIENVTAGATVNSTGTSATASDASVTTTDVDRLAVNFLAINNDDTPATFSGQSGGTWSAWQVYAEASGTDGSVSICTATMSTAGTISGGTCSITLSDAWGVVGFALIGTTPPSATRVPYVPSMPQLVAQ